MIVGLLLFSYVALSVVLLLSAFLVNRANFAMVDGLAGLVIGSVTTNILWTSRADKVKCYILALWAYVYLASLYFSLVRDSLYDIFTAIIMFMKLLTVDILYWHVSNFARREKQNKEWLLQ